MRKVDDGEEKRIKKEKRKKIQKCSSYARVLCVFKHDLAKQLVCQNMKQLLFERVRNFLTGIVFFSEFPWEKEKFTIKSLN